MGDYTALQLYVRLPQLDDDVRDLLLKRVSTAFADYGYNYWRGNDEQPDQDSEGDYGWGGEARCGSADELHNSLHALVADEDGEGLDPDADTVVPVPDFAWLLWEDPAYEWLGGMWLHVPGHPGDYSADCNAEGQPVFGVENVRQVLNNARDLDDAKRMVDDQLGTTAFAAWNAYKESVHVPA